MWPTELIFLTHYLVVTFSLENSHPYFVQGLHFIHKVHPLMWVQGDIEPWGYHKGFLFSHILHIFHPQILMNIPSKYIQNLTTALLTTLELDINNPCLINFPLIPLLVPLHLYNQSTTQQPARSLKKKKEKARLHHFSDQTTLWLPRAFRAKALNIFRDIQGLHFCCIHLHVNSWLSPTTSFP